MSVHNSPTQTIARSEQRDTPELRERQAREAARMLQTLIGNVDGMVYRCHDDSEWTMEFVSDGCFALTGYRPEELLMNSTISYEQLTHPDDRERVRVGIRAALAQQRRFDIEYRIVTRGGLERWVCERGIGLQDKSGQVMAIEGIIQDISEKESTLRALRTAERRYRSLFDNAIEGIFRTSPDGRYLDANPALARIYGFESPQQLIDSMSDISVQLYVDPGRRSEFIETIRRLGSLSGFESQIRRHDGRLIWISENARAIYGSTGQLQCYEGTVEEITELKLYQERIERQANHDDLTGLANRSLLRERLRDAIHAAGANDTRFALIFLDLDRFKYINDSLGHHAGDELLRITANRLLRCVRPTDTVARVGGDEFVLLVPDSGADAIKDLTRRVLQTIGEVWQFNGIEYRINSSIGVALYPDHGADPDTLLKNADAAMYLAKEQGRSTLRFFCAELRQQITDRLTMEQRLQQAIRDDHLLLHFQPRLDMVSGRITGAEALVRWQAPDEPLVQPASFIHIAEETGLIVDIGRFVVRAACAQARAWLDQGFPPLIISINASPRELQQERYAEQIVAALDHYALPAECLEIEITESMIVHDAPRLIRMLNQLRTMGVQIAVDDFGTGYSNLRYLQRFPAQRLKIDRSFISDLPRNTDDAAIVRAIITLGHSLGMRVVAEGVETQEQLKLLRELACDEVQGYLISQPMPAEALEAQLQRMV